MYNFWSGLVAGRHLGRGNVGPDLVRDGDCDATSPSYIHTVPIQSIQATLELETNLREV